MALSVVQFVQLPVAHFAEYNSVLLEHNCRSLRNSSGQIRRTHVVAAAAAAAAAAAVVVAVAAMTAPLLD